MLASDENNPEFVGARDPDSLLFVQFELRSRKNEFESQQQGRPIYYEQVYFICQPPGNNLLRIEKPIYPDQLPYYKAKWPRQWAFFEGRQGSGNVSGTPLEEWPALGRARVEELKGLKFYTVEQIAGCSDLQMQSLGMDGPTLRQKAQAFLKSAQDTALAQNQAVEIQKKDQENAELRATLAAMQKQIEELVANQKGKPGRKPKEPEAA